MARLAAALRLGCLNNAMMPEVTIGTAGMSHKKLPMEETED
jgi:hypothetical protein